MSMSDDQISFRKAKLANLPAIIALLAADQLGQTREDASLPLADVYVSAFQAIDSDENQFLAVVVDPDGIVIGTLQLSFIPGLARSGAWRGQIEAVRVAESHRGSGLGQQMFDWAIGKCRDRGCKLVQLTTDKTRPDAHRFYERLGFTASHEGFKLKL